MALSGIKAEKLISFIFAENKLLPIVERVENPKFPWDRFAALRELYGKGNLEERDPYIVDWLKIFTPIEYKVWQDIRYLGISMWPQYPVGRYFLDFGDPKQKLGIECDGRSHDPAKDRARDFELMDHGWSVIRIKGSDCYDEWRVIEILAPLYGIDLSEENHEEPK